MSIIHVEQIKAKITTVYNGLIDISDWQTHSEAAQESAFLTRAQAAYALMINANLTAELSAASVTDSGQDNGIDAIYYNDIDKILYLVQSKWKHQGKGSLERGDAQKFIQGVNDLVNVRFDRFNEKVKAKSSEIQKALTNATTSIVLLVVYTGQDGLSDEVQRDFDDILKEMNDPSEVIRLRVIKQAQLHSYIANETLGSPINLEVVLKNWGHVGEPYLAYFGCVAITEIADWWNNYHPRLFSPNLRAFLGMTEINDTIVNTLLSNPEHFWYFNNGITALCGSIKKKPLGGSSHDSGVFECEDVTIVNGAQTVGAIATAYARGVQNLGEATVLVRFISLENCPSDFASLVTRATNTQNKIESRDFVSLDPQQERLRTELKIEAIDYTYKSGDSSLNKVSGFDLTEATIALACSHQDLSHAVQAKREIGKLFEDINKPPYTTLFNASVNGKRLWRLVQIQRKIDEQLHQFQTTRDSRESMCAVHGNRFVARQVFRHLELSDLNNPVFSIDDILGAIPQIAEQTLHDVTDIIDELYPDSYLASLFKNLTKCRQIETSLKIESELYSRHL